MADNTRHPTSVEALTATLAQAGQSYEIFRLILKVLEEHEQVLYACREDMKLLRATSASADRRCAETMLKLAELRQEIRRERSQG